MMIMVTIVSVVEHLRGDVVQYPAFPGVEILEHLFKRRIQYISNRR